jgi:ribosomal protein L11 methylase PrmA
MTSGASLFLSGFYADDRDVIRATGEREGLQLLSFKEKDSWTAMHFAGPVAPSE